MNAPFTFFFNMTDNRNWSVVGGINMNLFAVATETTRLTCFELFELEIMSIKNVLY